VTWNDRLNQSGFDCHPKRSIHPSYTGAELQTMSLEDRATFNLLLVKAGWAATFPIYPSLPKYRDLILLHQAGKQAVETGAGIWGDPATLTGYEFRMCYRLWEVTKKLVAGQNLSTREQTGWVDRYCCDMTTLEIFEPADYHRVPPHSRIFIWPKQVTDAVGKLNLVPGA
jgi:hypothetical protein